MRDIPAIRLTISVVMHPDTGAMATALAHRIGAFAEEVRAAGLDVTVDPPLVTLEDVEAEEARRVARAVQGEPRDG